MSNKSGTRTSSQRKRDQQNRAERQEPSASAEMPASQEAKRDARLQRQAAARAAAERRRRVALVRKVGIIAAILLLLSVGGVAFYMNEANKPGESVAQQPSPHIQNEGEAHAAYSTDPPTSGPHLPGTAPWGISATPITKERQVHNLEDGGVIINYRPDLDKTTVDRLAEVAGAYSTGVVMSPYPGLSQPIVLTAWRRIDRLEALDEARIRRFIDEYRGKDRHAESGS